MTAVLTTYTAPRPRSRLRARIVLAGLSACGLAALVWASFVHPLPRLTYNPSDSVAVGWYRIDPFNPRTASLPRPLSVDSIVLVPLPATAAALAAQRGYLPTRVPLLKRVGAVAPQHVCIVAGQVRIDGVPSAAVLPADAAALAAQRGYLPAHVPLLKRVGAVAPQHVCIVAGQVRIDGVPMAAALPADRLGRALPSLQLCRRLEPGELLLLSVTNPASFDSRYFGPVSASAVIGVAHPVWPEIRP